MADGRVLMLKDSVKKEPNLAVTLLKGLALPRDYDQLPTELIPGLGDAGQAVLKAYDKAAKVTAERERYRTDRAKFKISESQLQETDAEVEKLKKELAEAKTAAATAEAEMEKMKMEEKKKLREADAKGYEAGIKRAALEYTQTAHQMVNDELETRLPGFFELGYAAGAEAMAGVLVVEADSKFLQQLPPPVIPDLRLPYSEEECAPLPPEEDEDEEMAEASRQDKPYEGVEKQDKAALAEGEDGAAATLNLLT
ncbi:hypothetical protein RHGRI_015328 [Rhododendron griersonianum]|uniref:Uncharacterized protein n=1 Tax=Rhododendron griersonianum TaxID=479676 RepID=A0AAV6KCU3_9ERIC|nr:hypothetical protein RHGRI_015328 [Rhododendron griersonianum]